MAKEQTPKTEEQKPVVQTEDEKQLAFYKQRAKELETEIEGLKEQLKATKKAEKETEKKIGKPTSIPASAQAGLRGQRGVRTVR